MADIGSGDGIIDLALTLRGRPRELVGYDVNPTPVDHLLEQAGRHARRAPSCPPGLSFRAVGAGAARRARRRPTTSS